MVKIILLFLISFGLFSCKKQEQLVVDNKTPQFDEALLKINSKIAAIEVAQRLAEYLNCELIPNIKDEGAYLERYKSIAKKECLLYSKLNKETSAAFEKIKEDGAINVPLFVFSIFVKNNSIISGAYANENDVLQQKTLGVFFVFENCFANERQFHDNEIPTNKCELIK